MHNCSAFFPLVRLNQRRWFVSVLSANANHNVVSLGLTLDNWSRRRDLNPQLADYKTAALPLSYIGLVSCICGAAHDSQPELLCATHTVMVDRQGVEPHLAGYKPAALPLHQRSVMTRINRRASVEVFQTFPCPIVPRMV